MNKLLASTLLAAIACAPTAAAAQGRACARSLASIADVAARSSPHRLQVGIRGRRSRRARRRICTHCASGQRQAGLFSGRRTGSWSSGPHWRFVARPERRARSTLHSADAHDVGVTRTTRHSRPPGYCRSPGRRSPAGRCWPAGTMARRDPRRHVGRAGAHFGWENHRELQSRREWSSHL